MQNSYNSYYAPTAYDSTRHRLMGPADNGRFGLGTRTLRTNMLPNHGSAQCREFLSVSSQDSAIEELNSNSAEIREYLQSPCHEQLEWGTLRNPLGLLRTFTGLMGLFAICSWGGGIFLSILAIFQKPDLAYYVKFGSLSFSPGMISTILYLIGKQIIKSGIIKNKNNVIFSRRKGTVAIPGKKTEIVEVLFDEFDAYLERTTNPSGREVFHLVLGHRYSPTRIPELGDYEAPFNVNIKWEFLLQYMDISNPLPDIPSMEPFRDRDPVTAAYDKQHNRPPRYWRDMDIQKAQQMHRASSEAADRFPWGLPRKQAIASGWQPSGFGEGDWRNAH